MFVIQLLVFVMFTFLLHYNLKFPKSYILAHFSCSTITVLKYSILYRNRLLHTFLFFKSKKSASHQKLSVNWSWLYQNIRQKVDYRIAKQEIEYTLTNNIIIRSNDITLLSYFTMMFQCKVVGCGIKSLINVIYCNHWNATRNHSFIIYFG